MPVYQSYKKTFGFNDLHPQTNLVYEIRKKDIDINLLTLQLLIFGQYCGILHFQSGVYLCTKKMMTY